MTNHSNLAKLGRREIGQLAELLDLYSDNKLTNIALEFFRVNEVNWEYNPYSDNLFLVDEDYNTLMKNGDKLDLWLFTPYYGIEGFLSDILDQLLNDCKTNMDDLKYISNYIYYSDNNEDLYSFKKILTSKVKDGTVDLDEYKQLLNNAIGI